MFHRIALLTLGFLVSGLSSTTLAASPASPAHAIKPAPRVVISGEVLMGMPSRFSQVAEVDRRAVFEAIPAIRTIREEKLSRKSARYHFLVVEANKVFHKAMAKIAGTHGVDLIVVRGGVKAAGVEVSDLTEELVQTVK